MAENPSTLGALRESGIRPRGVRDELRENLISALRRGESLFPGIIGYEETVVPQVVNAILSRHDILLLGLRGQAKTRLARGIQALLDAETPVIPGDPLRSHPLAPQGAFAQRVVAEQGDALEIEWLPRELRYGEKLATPDVNMADLIGDIDPLKAANEGLDLSNEEVIHYGIVPRANRGVFVINELPDLAPRIQVGLLNILEEQDIQVRGFPLRIPLDLLFVFTANPEDYTNRGSIITPLKDRIASQILTHYPEDLASAHAITEQEAWSDRGEDAPAVIIPPFVADIVESIAFEGRVSEYVDQSSGVSARLAIAAREILVSQVERRALLSEGADPVPRLVDLDQLSTAILGKIELVYEGEQEGAVQVARHLIGQACQKVFDAHFPDVVEEGASDAEGKVKADRYRPILDHFNGGHRVELSDSQSDEDYLATLSAVPGLDKVAREFLPEAFAVAPGAAMELVLEGLHQHSMVAKEDVQRGAAYTDMMGLLMKGMR